MDFQILYYLEVHGWADTVVHHQHMQVCYSSKFLFDIVKKICNKCVPVQYKINKCQGEPKNREVIEIASHQPIQRMAIFALVITELLFPQCSTAYWSKNVLGVVHKGRPHKIDPLVRKMSALAQPPCPCRHTINFEKSDVFYTKKCGRPHLKNPSSLVRTGQPLHLTAYVFYGQPLLKKYAILFNLNQGYGLRKLKAIKFLWKRKHLKKLEAESNSEAFDFLRSRKHFFIKHGTGMRKLKHFDERRWKQTRKRLTLYCTNVSPPQRGVAVSAPLFERWAEMARQLPRGARPSGCAQLSGNIFSFSRPLTSRSCTATLFFLYDRTLICSPPFTRLLILLLQLASQVKFILPQHSKCAKGTAKDNAVT